MKHELIYNQGVGVVNEDAWLVHNNVFGVFDGATSMNRFIDRDGKTGGYLASHITKEVFLDKEISLKEGFRLANKKIEEKMIELEIDTSKKTNLWVTSAAVVKIVGQQMEWAQIGDCLILLVNKDGSHHLLVTDYDYDRDTLTTWHNLARQKIDNIKNHPSIIEQMTKKGENMGITYGALNGEKVMLDFVNSGVEDISDVAHVILFTDGLQVPQEDPALDDDFNIFVNLYLSDGLQGIMEYVRREEKGDPNLWKYPRFKIHDDIAAISVTI